MPKYLLFSIVFLTGLVTMAFEITGSRLVAPYLGSSTIVWTSLIGSILAALSIGNIIGGNLADKGATKNQIFWMIVSSAFFVAISPFIASTIIASCISSLNSFRLASLFATFILFAPASVILGMITPCCVRLGVSSLETSGKTVGRFYACSTLGSIVGTFLFGFYLLPILGTRHLTITLAAILLIAGLILTAFRFISPQRRLYFLMIALLVASIAKVSTANQIDIDTQYAHLRVIDWKIVDIPHDRIARRLETDPFGYQSMIYMDEPNTPAYPVAKHLRIADGFVNNPERALAIGGSIMAQPRDFIARHNDTKIDVVEIDPALPVIAERYFGFLPHPNINIITEDGRTYVNRTDQKYDIIFLDAFGSSFTPPPQLLSEECIAYFKKVLNSDGIVVMNLISALEGREATIGGAIFNTFHKIFPDVRLYEVGGEHPPYQARNLTLVAGDHLNPQSNDSEIATYLSKQVKLRDPLKAGVFNDDFVPVENLLEPILDRVVHSQR